MFGGTEVHTQKKHATKPHACVLIMVTNGNFRVLMVAALGRYSMFSWILSHTIHGTGIFTYIQLIFMVVTVGEYYGHLILLMEEILHQLICPSGINRHGILS